MKLSTLCKADRQTQLYRKAITIRESMKKRRAWYDKHHPLRITALHIQRMGETEKNLSSESDLIEMNLLPKNPLLARPVGELLNWVFEGLPPPRKAQHTEFEKTLIELLTERGRLARGNAQRFLIAAETAHRASLGWFMVFNTLTVEPGAYYRVFNKQSKEFKNYVRNFARKIDQAEGASPPGAQRPGSPGTPRDRPNHTYVAVVEEGSKHGRLHIHVLHHCRTLPAGSRDPNRGKPLPSNREISCLRTLWPHGQSSPIAVRTSDIDAYGQIGWRWPFDTKKNRPLRFRSNQAVAAYVGKYITKGYLSPKRKKLLWRVRKNHSHGLHVLQHLLNQLTPRQLLNLATIPISLRLNNQTIPAPLLSWQALTLYRLRDQPTQKPNASLLHLAKSVSPLPSLLRSSPDSTLAIHENNLRSISSTLTAACSPAATYDDTAAAALAAAAFTDQQFYRRSNNAFGTTSTIDSN